MEDNETKKTLKRKLKSELEDDPTTSKKKRKGFAKDAVKKRAKQPNEPQWTINELLAEQQNLTLSVSTNIIELFEAGNTIPFIARYRRDLTNNMSPEALREIKGNYEEIVQLRHKIETVVKTLERNNLLDSQLRHSVTASRSIEEVEHVYAPFKPGSKRSLAERAKELGLGEPALCILNNTKKIRLSHYVDNDNKELCNEAEVEKGIIHVISSIMSTNTDILSHLRQLRKQGDFKIKTKKIASKQPPSKDDFKFEKYMNFEIPVKYIKPHQVLAINRGESLKVLSVKVIVPDVILNSYKTMCFSKWLCLNEVNSFKKKVLLGAINDSYSRLVQPLIMREIRAELKQKAERASCEVFSANLKQLLLAKPIKGHYILGLDPGFANGCKLALISPMGDLITSGVIYPFKQNNMEKDVIVLKKMLLDNNCEIIALGNGTACRQTEEWLCNLIQQKVFHPFNVRYTIVREEGASIYSCSSEAKKEFPKLDPNIISAVSLARRIQEPLAELVKIEPKHLGVGMYQHDVKKKNLEEALNTVVSECVSFVGVDLNTTSQCLLKHIAGMSDKKAQRIIDYRTENGPFICRKEIMDVSGIGQKLFQQCAGFLRVGPLQADEADAFYKQAKTCRLDCTYIHPESYEITLKILKKVGLKVKDLGEQHFIGIAKNEVPNLDVHQLKKDLKCTQENINLIFDALTKPLNYDLRSDIPSEPMFKKTLTSINGLEKGAILTGRVENVTHFGCFVDIGVGFNGLIHASGYSGLSIELGNRIEVKVISVEAKKRRVGLQALKLL